MASHIANSSGRPDLHKAMIASTFDSAVRMASDLLGSEDITKRFGYTFGYRMCNNYATFMGMRASELVDNRQPISTAGEKCVSIRVTAKPMKPSTESVSNTSIAKRLYPFSFQLLSRTNKGLDAPFNIVHCVHGR